MDYQAARPREAASTAALTLEVLILLAVLITAAFVAWPVFASIMSPFPGVLVAIPALLGIGGVGAWALGYERQRAAVRGQYARPLSIFAAGILRLALTVLFLAIGSLVMVEATRLSGVLTMALLNTPLPQPIPELPSLVIGAVLI